LKKCRKGRREKEESGDKTDLTKGRKKVQSLKDG
jgi:hypothetical protein